MSSKDLQLMLASERKRVLENLLEGFARVKPVAEDYVHAIEQFIRVEDLVIKSINEAEGTAEKTIEVIRDSLIKRLYEKGASL